MFLCFHLLQTVKTSGDVHIADSAVGAVAGPGANIGVATVVTKLHPPVNNKGEFSNNFIYCFSWKNEKERERESKSERVSERERERVREKERERQRETDRDRERQREKEKEGETERDRLTEKQRWTNWRAERYTKTKK